MNLICKYLKKRMFFRDYYYLLVCKNENLIKKYIKIDNIEYVDVLYCVNALPLKNKIKECANANMCRNLKHNNRYVNYDHAIECTKCWVKVLEDKNFDVLSSAPSFLKKEKKNSIRRPVNFLK